MSRFITYPSVEPKSLDHTVVLIDANIDDIERVGLFCKQSNKEYDIYLYRSDLSDLEWLSSIVVNSDTVLLNELSTECTNSKIIKFGSRQILRNPVDYFQEYDQQNQSS
jgi:hypothetical protein